jgi:Uma2 family endonuclease
MTALTLNLHSTIELTGECFEQICQSNRDLRFERTSTGELVVMLPAGSDTGRQNCELSGQLWVWNQQIRLGVGFDSSAGFTLPNSAIRSPDVSWIKQERWNSLNAAQKRKFAPICPDNANKKFIVNTYFRRSNWQSLCQHLSLQLTGKCKFKLTAK